MIREGLDNLEEIPADRVGRARTTTSNKTAKDKIYCTRGGFIPDFDFDPRVRAEHVPNGGL